MTSPSVDRQTFLANVQRSGLLSRRALAAAAQLAPGSDRGKDLARALVRAGWLTRFQAEQLLAGRTRGFLLGQYCILDYLGKGGMGRVYKALHRRMHRLVALKVLAPELVRTPRARQLFKQEMRAAARLLHPNIVTAYDANKVDNCYFLVMEYVDGINLDQGVRQQGPLPLGLACDLIRQTAVGLQYAADLGMIHRDIKPSNLMVTRGPVAQIKILDFGLARLQKEDAVPAAGEAGIPRTILGTPDYLAPEQIRNIHEVDIRADLYSLGCTFYYLLTGQVPFPGGTSAEKLMRHLRDEPAPITTLRPELPPALAQIVHRLLAKDPAARFQRPADLAQALLPFCAAGPAGSLNPPVAARAAPASPAETSAVDLGANPAATETGATPSSTWPPDQVPTLLPGDSNSGTPAPHLPYWRGLFLALLLSSAVFLGVAGLLLIYLLFI